MRYSIEMNGPLLVFWTWQAPADLGIWPPVGSKVPFVQNGDIHCWLPDPITFRQAPIFINFEGKARAEKTLFLVQIFQKVLKNSFLAGFFFQNYARGAENLAKTGSF